MKNNRVVLCTPNLKYIHEIGKYKLTTPRAVLVHLDQVIIADNSDTFNIHIYAKTGEFLKSFIKLENGTDHIFMCLDGYSNILVSDDKDKSIQVYSTEGERVHRIECKGYPRGILVHEGQIEFSLSTFDETNFPVWVSNCLKMLLISISLFVCLFVCLLLLFR